MLTADMLDYAARRFPDKAALVDGERSLTFSGLAEASNRFANALLARGLGKEDRIAVMLPNVLEYPIVHYGAARTNVVLAHLSYRYTPKDLAFVLNKIAAKILVYHADFSDLVAELIADVPSIQSTVVVGALATSTIGSTDFNAFIAEASPIAPRTEIADNDPNAITFTGGTTGTPKAVVGSHKCRIASAIAVAIHHGLGSEDRAAIVTPLFHVAGLFVWFQPLIWLGCTCSLLPTWDPEAFMDMVARDSVSAAFLVPTQLNGLVHHPRFDPSKLATLRHIGYAGSPMPPALIADLRAALPRVAFTENYGQSETGLLTIKPHWEHPAHPDSIGRPALNVAVDVFGPTGTPLPPGEVGEIVTRGDHLLLEYLGEPEQTRALYRFGDDWLATGDLGFRDPEGFVTLVDRSKDMIISGGENIYPKEIEDVLYRHEAVQECTVFGVPDDHWGEVPAAHIVLRVGMTVSADELVAFSVERLARYKRPRLIEFVESIPKTPVGKVQKHLIREPYWHGRAKRI
jgi:fatty-acyl-CoA synthase